MRAEERRWWRDERASHDRYGTRKLAAELLYYARQSKQSGDYVEA